MKNYRNIPTRGDVFSLQRVLLLSGRRLRTLDSTTPDAVPGSEVTGSWLESGKQSMSDSLMDSVSQPWQDGLTFRARPFFVVGALGCTWGYLAAHLASTHQMPVQPPPPQVWWLKCLQALVKCFPENHWSNTFESSSEWGLSRFSLAGPGV